MPRFVVLIVFLGLVAAPLQARQFHTDSTTAASSLSDSTMQNAYRIYTPAGDPVSLDALVAAMDSVDVVFIGEEHDDPVAHYLQLALLARAYRHFAVERTPHRPVALSMEMFERDTQPVLDEYLAGLITEQHFLRRSSPPGNYATDYRPLIEFARVHGVPVIASNAPRRYVNRVSRFGAASLADLPPVARTWLPPLPYPRPLPAYADKWKRLMADMMAEMAPPPSGDAPAAEPTEPSAPTMPAAEDSTAGDEASGGGPMHGGGSMMEAQALWDASMAHAITQYLYAVPGALVVHVVGSFHAEEGLGTPAQLNHYRPDTRRLIVVVQPTDDVTRFDADALGALGDYVVLSDERLPRSGGTVGQ